MTRYTTEDEAMSTAKDPLARRVSGLASAYALDLGGDVILPGAYSQWLSEWRERADPSKDVPLKNSHLKNDIWHVLGRMIDARETADGLLASFDIIESPMGDEALARIKSGAVTGLSIGYYPGRQTPASDADRAKGIRRYVHEVSIAEVSLTDNPMNQRCRATVVLGKSLDALESDLRARRLAELMAFRSDSDFDADDATDDDSQGLEPNDPKRIAMEEGLRELRLAQLRAARDFSRARTSIALTTGFRLAAS